MSGGDSIDGEEQRDREDMKHPVTIEWLKQQLTKGQDQAA